MLAMRSLVRRDTCEITRISSSARAGEGVRDETPTREDLARVGPQAQEQRRIRSGKEPGGRGPRRIAKVMKAGARIWRQGRARGDLDPRGRWFGGSRCRAPIVRPHARCTLVRGPGWRWRSRLGARPVAAQPTPKVTWPGIEGRCRQGLSSVAVVKRMKEYCVCSYIRRRKQRGRGLAGKPADSNQCRATRRRVAGRVARVFFTAAALGRLVERSIRALLRERRDAALPSLGQENILKAAVSSFRRVHQA